MTTAIALESCVGNWVRIRHLDGSPHFHGAKLFQIEGHRCLVKPVHHKKTEWVETERVVPWKSRMGEQPLDAPAASLWVIADATLPRYFGGDEVWTGDPTDATTYPVMTEAMLDMAKITRDQPGGPSQPYPCPLPAAMERYEASEVADDGQLPAAEPVIVERLVEIQVPGQSVDETIGQMVARQTAAVQARDEARATLAKCEAEVRQSGEALRTWLDKLSAAVRLEAPATRRPMIAPKGELRELLHRCLTPGRRWSVRQAVDAIVTAGWSSASTEKNIMVSKALGTDQYFERLEQGVYRVRQA